MIFTETKIKGVFEIDLQKHEDHRGWFARSWCEKEFQYHGLDPRLVQCNLSFNHKKGTIRGMHIQADPHGEPKLVRVIKGAIFDVAVDLRPASETYRQWVGVNLNAENRKALFIPTGCAHGFQTLADDTEILYQMGEFYHADLASGFHFEDPEIRIEWPLPPVNLSEKDLNLPLLAKKEP